MAQFNIEHSHPSTLDGGRHPAVTWVLARALAGLPVEEVEVEALPGVWSIVLAAVRPEPVKPASRRIDRLREELGKTGKMPMADIAATMEEILSVDLLAAKPDANPQIETSGTPELPARARLPEQLGRGACPWLDRYIAFSRTWSPCSFDGFHEACGLWILSTVAARRVCVSLGGRQFTPLYIALAARSSLYAKSTAAEIALDVIRAAGLGYLLAADDATPQRFIRDLAGEVPDDFDELPEELRKRALMRLAFPGQRGWCYEQFGQKLEAMTRNGGFMADFRGILRRLDDCPESYEYASIGRGTDRVEGPYLALLAILTPADIAASAKRGGAFWRDGFWARFSFVTPPAGLVRSRARFPSGLRIVPSEITAPLLAWHERLSCPQVRVEDVPDKNGQLLGRKRAVVTPMQASILPLGEGVEDAAYCYHDSLSDLVDRSANQDLDGSYTRFFEKALRIAALFASVQGTKAVELAHWARAQEITERWRAGLHALYEQANAPTPSRSAETEERVIEIIHRLGQPGTAREIAQRIRNLGTMGLEPILDALVRTGTLIEHQSAKTRRYSLPRQDGRL